MRKTRLSAASSYSLSEFAYLLLFIFIGASVILYVMYTAETEKSAALTKEVTFLQKMLDEKKDGAVPCWRRPDAKVPKIAGVITILGISEYSVRSHAVPEETFWKTGNDSFEQRFSKVLLKIFRSDMKYAKGKKCYIRVKIVNETNNYSLYKQTASILKKLGIVLVNE